MYDNFIRVNLKSTYAVSPNELSNRKQANYF